MAGDEYMRLVDAYKSTAGYRIYWQIHSVIVSHGIFAGNHKELHQRLTEYTDPKIAARLFKQGEYTAAEAELRELIRLVHNYVASVKTLVDHTRRIAAKVLEADTLAVYQKRIDFEFKNDATSKFLQDLRNYLLHVSHPPLKAKLRFNQGAGMASGIELAPGELLQWDNWSAESRTFINSHPDGVVMLTVVDDYDRKVQAFYEWLIDYFHESRRTEMDEFWAKQDEWAKFCGQQGISITEGAYREFFKRTEAAQERAAPPASPNPPSN